MEATTLSVGKSVLDGALGYAKSALAEEVALQLGVHRDHAFIRDELEMMQAFLMAAHEECDEHVVVKTWVKQVRDVAYDAEDSLQDFAVRLAKPSWWRILRMLLNRHSVATRMKELKVKVEDVSQRNMRYQLIKGSGSKAATTSKNSHMVGTTMSGTEEAMRQRNKAKLDLIQLIHNKKDEDLNVIAIWGASDILGESSVVRRAYDDLKRDNKFECQAWISIAHPFNRIESLQNIVIQLYVDSLHEAEKSGPGVHDLRRMGAMKEGDLIGAFHKYISEKSFLVVFTNLSSNEEWGQIKACFPNNKKGSRLIVCTGKVQVASLCVGEETEMPEHKQLSSDPRFIAFYEKGSCSMDPGPSSRIHITDKNGSTDEKKLTRMGTMLSAYKESQLIGRMDEKSEIVKLVLDNRSQEFQVISICGMGGLGKTTLVKHVYQSQELCTMFEKRACVTVKRPFDPNELINSLVTQLTVAGGDREKTANQPSLLTHTLEGKKYLVVLDDLSSTAEWDAINHYFPRTETGSRVIVTTRVESIANHCSKKQENIHKLKTLGEKDACNLFTQKVFGNIIDFNEQYPELAEMAKLILKKCHGLPLAIVTIGGFLSKQPKTPMEWRKLNEQIGAELEINEELGIIKDILIKSYDGLPYHLKSCYLYMSIFPEDHNISRRRLVRRWIAEGYTREMRGKSLEDVGDSYFMELIDRSMVLPFQESIGSRNGVDSCQLHDLMREISISKSMEENLVFRMEERCRSNTMGMIRHLAISSNWKGDKMEYESAVDLSRVRSLTVFGKWRSFYISKKMRLLRVLDLESTYGLVNHHLEHIGSLLHLKYISLRRCYGIYHLPDSWGNLLQLETLDIKGTRIYTLPQTIIKLRKLQHLFGGDLVPACRIPNHMRKLCLACCAPKYLKGVAPMGSDPNRHDVCIFWWHVVCPTLASRRHPYGIIMPKGVGKLKSLHTLGLVNIGEGKAILQDIRRLTQLRKLAVRVISKKNCEEFCSTLADLNRLESLSVEKSRSHYLHDLLDKVSTPPSNLQSLKLGGRLVKLTEWIGKLQNLVKLKLASTRLSEADDTLQLLGKLPNLAILRLHKSFEEQVHRLTFRQGASFPSLMVLELHYVCGWGPSLNSVEYEEGATPKLELLRFCGPSDSPDILFSGLAALPKLKAFEQDLDTYAFEENVQVQLAHNLNRPIFRKLQ